MPCAILTSRVSFHSTSGCSQGRSRKSGCPCLVTICIRGPLDRSCDPDCRVRWKLSIVERPRGEEHLAGRERYARVTHVHDTAHVVSPEGEHVGSEVDEFEAGRCLQPLSPKL